MQILDALRRAVDRLPDGCPLSANGVTLVIEAWEIAESGMDTLANDFRKRRQDVLSAMCHQLGYKDIWLVGKTPEETARLWPVEVRR